MASSSAVTVPAIRVDEKGLPAYVTRIRAGDLLDLYDVKQFSAEELDWYQRQRFQKKAIEMKGYLANCPIAVVPSVLLGVPQKVHFEPSSPSSLFGMVELERRRGAVNMIDGQHRIAGFDVARDELRSLEQQARLSGLSDTEKERATRLKVLMEYEVPAVILDSTVAIQIAKDNRAKHFETEQLTTLNAERVIFFILNKTQKGLNPSLKDQLAYRIWFSGIRGIPAIEEQEWRAYATRIVEALKKPGSPLEGHIVDATFASMGRRVRLSSFVTSLHWLFADPTFFTDEPEGLTEQERDRQHEVELAFVTDYWRVVRTLFPEAFKDSSRHLLLRTLSVYAMNRLAADVYSWVREEGLEPNMVEIGKRLEGLRGFDWGKDSSPVRAFGGQQGASEAYKLLLRCMADRGDKRALAKLKGISG